MTEETLRPGPLIGDPKRQAVDSIRGWAFQLWHSVHAWLDLGDDELLYLEGAEDYDLLDPSGATSVQVKSSAGTITLRSPEVIQAIDQYWLIRSKNEQPVRYRLLTRASIGIERGVPFGSGTAGLMLWERGREDRQAAEAVRAFLTKEGRLADSLMLFLHEASAPEVQTQLLERISWETESRGPEGVKEAIERKLINHGERWRVPPSKAKSVADHLLNEALRVAGSAGERRLSRADFLQLFEQETTERIPVNDLQELQRLASFFGQSLKAANFAQFGQIIATEHTDLSVPPLIKEKIAKREQMVEDLIEQLKAEHLLVLSGSTGMGKTTLANLITERFSQEWHWVELGHASPDRVPPVLRHLGVLLDTERSRVGIVLDGYDQQATRGHRLTGYLSGLLHTSLERACPVIVTSHNPLPGKVLALLNRSSDVNRTVPGFTAPEIAELAHQLGCPDKSIAANWGRLVLLQTGGHPQLVHARLLALSQGSWPQVSDSDLSSAPAEIAEERLSAREQLLEVASETQRELVFRLSVLTGPFRRDHAVQIAVLEPEIPQPGAVFDSLVGPWVERIDNSYHRLSLLLMQSGDEVWPVEQLIKLRSGSAAALLKCGSLCLIEAAQILELGLLAQSPEPVLSVTCSLLALSDEALQPFGAASPMFLCWAIGAGERAFAADVMVNTFVRMLQFRVAVVADPNLAGAVAARLDAETRLADLSGQDVPLRLLAVMCLCNHHGEMSAGEMVRLLAEYGQIENETAQNWPDLLPAIPARAEFATRDVISELARTAVLRNMSSTFLSALFGELCTVSEDLRTRILGSFRENPLDRQLLIDLCWIKEFRQNDPDWPACLDALDHAYKQAKRWAHPELAAAAAAASSLIHDEHLDDELAALGVLGEAEKELGERRALREQRAKVALNRKRHAEAFMLWDTLFPEGQPLPRPGTARSSFSCRCGGIAAAAVGKWSRAAWFFHAAHEYALEQENPAGAVGLLADAGFAHWKAAQTDQTIHAFAQTLRLLETLPEPDDDFTVHVVSKRIGHVLLWLRSTLAEEMPVSLAAPFCGVCSDPEHSTEFGSLPPNPVGIAWVFLAEIEFFLEARAGVYEEVTDRFSMTPYAQFHVCLSELSIKYSYRNQSFDHFILQCIRLNTSISAGGPVTEHGRELARIDPSILNEAQPTGIATMMLAGPLLVLAAHNRLASAPALLTAWRRDAEVRKNTQPILDWIETVENTLNLPVREAVRLMRDEYETWDPKIVASLVVGADPSATPDQVFWAHVSLFQWLERDIFRRELSSHFATLLQHQWLRMSQNPAALRTPRLTVPSIREACETHSNGIEKAARILLAAREAVSVRLPDDMLCAMKKCAASK